MKSVKKYFLVSFVILLLTNSIHAMEQSASSSSVTSSNNTLASSILRATLESASNLLDNSDRIKLLNDIKKLLDKGANINCICHDKFTPLHLACRLGHFDLIKLFLEKGANVNAKNSLGQTPLHLLCMQEALLLVEILLDYEANPFLEDYLGKTSRDYSPNITYLIAYDYSIYRQILKNYIRFKQSKCPICLTPFEKGKSVTCLYCGHAFHDECIQAWHQITCPVCAKKTNTLHAKTTIEFCDKKPQEGLAPIHTACIAGHLIQVQELLTKNKELINLKTTKEWTPLHFASFHGHFNIANFLLNAGADINAKNNDGKTAMFLAHQNKHAEIVGLLCKALLPGVTCEYEWFKILLSNQILDVNDPHVQATLKFVEETEHPIVKKRKTKETEEEENKK